MANMDENCIAFNSMGILKYKIADVLIDYPSDNKCDGLYIKIK